MSDHCASCGGPLVCSGCGSTETIGEIKLRHPEAISCCPERNMRAPQPSDRAAVIEADDEDDGNFVEAMMRAVICGSPMRLAIVSDEQGTWYLRRIRLVEHDLDLNEKVYHCDVPIGQNFATLDEAVDAAKIALAASPPAQASPSPKSAPVDYASHNSGERRPSSDAAGAGADTASPSPDGWRDIETAPKDGTWVLVWETGVNTKYHPAEVSRYRENITRWKNSANNDVFPTHWQPLPAPPSRDGGDK